MAIWLRWFLIKTSFRVWWWNHVKRHYYAWRYPHDQRRSEGCEGLRGFD